MLHVKSDLNVLIRFYISRFDYEKIGSTKIGRGLVGAGGELGLRPCGSRCALAARAARSQLALHARDAHSRLAHAHSFCKKYMNSYMITAKNI
jgi:hypothetical protein